MPEHEKHNSKEDYIQERINKKKQRPLSSFSDPFLSQGALETSACVDNLMGFGQLAGCYVSSADVLVESSLEDHSLLDVHVYAICFLYRHALELMLKDMVWKSHCIRTGEKRFMMSDWRELGRHRLNDLWSKAYPDTSAVLPGGWPLNHEAHEQIEQLLVQFERHDPDSFSFRYPLGKKTGRTHPKVKNVDILVLKTRMHQVADHLVPLLDKLDWCLENQRE